MKPGRPSQHQTLPVGVCRYGACLKPGKGKPPLCEIHTVPPANATTIPWEVSLAARTSGHARVAKARRA